MSAVITPVVGALGQTPQSPTKARIVHAALELFADQGVSGTSLQMIADAIGVTKAAVYHQFPTKEAIVVAATEVELSKLEGALNAAEAEESGRNGLDLFVTGVIDLAVERRQMVITIQHDPVVIRLLAVHAPFQKFMARLDRVLIGSEDGPEARVKAAMIASAIGGAVTHPLVANLDDDTLRAHLQYLTRDFLNLNA